MIKEKLLCNENDYTIEKHKELNICVFNQKIIKKWIKFILKIYKKN